MTTGPARGDETTRHAPPVGDSQVFGEQRTPIEPHNGPAAEPVAREPALKAGDTVGRYVLLEPVGSGGMGVVFAARDPTLERKVAIKVVRPQRSELVGRACAQDWLAREAQAMAQLSHANVVEIYDVGLVGSNVFLAMEYLDGDSLSQWQFAQPRPSSEILRAYCAAGEGLAAAHAVGIVHRDFKPANVSISADGREVHVIDFGLAHAAGNFVSQAPGFGDEDSAVSWGFEANTDRLAAPLPGGAEVFGTPLYMAPEHHRGRTAEAAGDQFSFCVAVYAALYQVRPYAARSVEGLLAEKERGALVLGRARKGVPKSMRAVVVRGMAANPFDRWPSMRVLLDELARAGRRRGIGVAVGVGVACVAALLGWWAYTSPEPSCVAETALDGVWDDPAQARVQTAILATQAGYAQESWDHVEDGVSAYTQQWSAAYEVACRRAADPGTQRLSADRALACLARQRVALGATLEVLADVDQDVLARAVGLVQGLDEPSTCVSHTQRSEFAGGPPSIALQAGVEEARAVLARSRALSRGGRYGSAHDAAMAGLELARATAYEPVVVEAELEVAVTQIFTAPTVAEAALANVLYAAESIAYDRIVVLAASQLAHLVGKSGRYEEGIRWARHGQSILARMEHAQAYEAELLWALGSVNIGRGNNERALELYRDGLALVERQEDPLGEAAGRNNMGVALYALGRYDEAVEEYERALAIRVETLGPTHPNVGAALNNLANAYGQRGRLKEAWYHHKRALELRRMALGSEHPEVASSLQNLGNVALRMRKFDVALEHNLKALELRERLLGPDNLRLAESRLNISSIYIEAKQPDEAIKYIEQAREIYERVQGPRAATIGLCRGNYAEALELKGRLIEALVEVEAVIALWQQTLPPRHPYLAYAFALKGRMQLKLRRYGEARTSLERALELDDGARGDPLQAAKARFDLARALAAAPGDRGKPAVRALALAKEALAVMETRSDATAEAQQVRAWVAEH